MKTENKNNYNHWRKILDEMKPYEKVKVVPHSEEDKEVAEQMSKLMNHYIDTELEEDSWNG